MFNYQINFLTILQIFEFQLNVDNFREQECPCYTIFLKKKKKKTEKKRTDSFWTFALRKTGPTELSRDFVFVSAVATV